MPLGGPFLLARFQMTLPIAGEVHGLAAPECQPCQAMHLSTVIDPPIVLAPCRLLSIPQQVSASNVMMMADFSTTYSTG